MRFELTLGAPDGPTPIKGRIAGLLGFHSTFHFSSQFRFTYQCFALKRSGPAAPHSDS